MKKTIFALFLAVQSTAAFANVQVLNCKGTEAHQDGTSPKAVSAEMKIINPVAYTLLGISGDGAADRASISVDGLPKIDIDEINVNSNRTAITFSGSVSKSNPGMTASIMVPYLSIGAAGDVQVTYTTVKWFSADKTDYLTGTLTCTSALQSGF